MKWLGKVASMVAVAWHRLVTFVSGEWMLQTSARRPNGGGIVLGRALWASVLLYAASVALKEALDPSKGRNVSLLALRQVVLATVPWFGAIFAATYIAFYTRFSSQWLYLAGVYNQIKTAELRMHEKEQPTDAALEALADWKAGFIEDADDLHLATKPLFANVIYAWSEDPRVADSRSGPGFLNG